MTAFVVTLAIAFSLAAPQGEATPRGITGSVTITHQGEALVAQPDQQLTSPVLVRLTDTTPGAAADSPHTYRIDYIAVVAGSHDLREHLRHRDGSAVDELAPIQVDVVSELPERHGTDLFGTPTRPFFTRNHYRLIGALVAIAWVAVPAVFLIRRAIRNRPTPPAPPPPPPPTLADQLRPLAESAMNGSLSLEDQARLELLLLAFWSQRRDLSEKPPAEAIAALRHDPEASPLLLAVEHWLHSREGAPRDLGALLEPYRAHAQVELPARASEGAEVQR